MASVVVGFLTSASKATADSVAHAGVAQSQSSPAAQKLLLRRRIAKCSDGGPNAPPMGS